MRPLLFLIFISLALCLKRLEISLVLDYFEYKKVNHISYISCDQQYAAVEMSKAFAIQNKRVSVRNMNSNWNVLEIVRFLNQYYVPVGVLVDGDCYNISEILLQASKFRLFDDTRFWFVTTKKEVMSFIEDQFSNLNLSVSTDIVVAKREGDRYRLIDVYNFGKIQGNRLEIVPLGCWRADNGINIRNDFKYYSRWDFNNLTLRAITVAVDQPRNVPANILSEVGYTKGVAAMTKISNQLLNVIKETHNFRLQYTAVERYVAPPNRNAPLAVTNALYWEMYDLAATTARFKPLLFQWVDFYYPHTTYVQTKFYYVISDQGIGQYENRFLSPLSTGVWLCTVGAVCVCTTVLSVGAVLEARPYPAVYAFFSVYAVICQETFVEGREGRNGFHSQGRRITVLVVGITSMLLYNYYTSSVVSWLLNAAAPSISSLDQLINSDLELIFEDTGYTRGWLDNPGNVYYYSGYKNVKENELREKKVNKTRRTVYPLQPVDKGIELIKTGKYTYHTEPYIASEVIARSFTDDQLCRLGALQMMPPAPVYIMTTKRSPYKQFFVWSLLRLLERGHSSVSRARFSGKLPHCSGRRPRALALGQAAPAFALLLIMTMVALVMLMVEVSYYRFSRRSRA